MKETDKNLLDQKIKIAVIGSGGTGSFLINQMARMHKALVSLGHPSGIHLTAYDPDEVTEANIGRQSFYECDLGTNKAIALINKINIAYKIEWEAVPEKFKNIELNFTKNIIIGCVDSGQSRQEIKKELNKDNRWSYYIDCGNGSHYAQIILSENPKKYENPLPMPWETYPELINSKNDKNTPSCSLAEALFEQELMINPTTAIFATQLIYKMLRTGYIEHSGYFINLETGQTKAIKATSLGT